MPTDRERARAAERRYEAKRQSDESLREQRRERSRAHYAANAERLRGKIVGWQAANRERLRPSARARVAVWQAIKRGDLVRPDACSRCGRTGFIEAAHADYSLPFDITWLCRSCHRRLDHAEPKTPQPLPPRRVRTVYPERNAKGQFST